MFLKPGDLCFIILCVTFSAIVWCADFSAMFTRTKVVLELEYCTFHNKLIQKQQPSTTFGCVQLCSAVKDCRRFMYDEEIKLCSLYKTGENCMTTGAVDKKVCYRQNSLCDAVNCTRCPIGYYGDRCQHIIQDCYGGFTQALLPRESYQLSFIQPLVNGPIIEVVCYYVKWTVLLYRSLQCLELDFNRTFDEYSKGFGNSLGNYFIGLDNIHNLVKLHDRTTSFSPMIYLLGDSLCTGFYGIENIANKTENYRISIGGYRDRPIYCGDSITNGSYSINGRPFSTFDRDFTNYSCPARFGGGWWYLDDPVCSRSNLHGKRSGADFQSTWHWQDNLGNKTSFGYLLLRLS